MNLAFHVRFCPTSSLPLQIFKLDPALTVFLGVGDRSVINLHLLHTSFFLFLMVVMVLCVTACRANSHHNAVRNCSAVVVSHSASEADQKGKYALVT